MSATRGRLHPRPSVCARSVPPSCPRLLARAPRRCCSPLRRRGAAPARQAPAGLLRRHGRRPAARPGSADLGARGAAHARARRRRRSASPSTGATCSRTRGGPIDWAATDRIVAAAARERARASCPVVVRAPAWARAATRARAPSPRGDAPTRAFLDRARRALRARRDVLGRAPGPAAPIRSASGRSGTSRTSTATGRSPRPFADALRARCCARATAPLKAADPGAEVVLAGLTNRSWRELADALPRRRAPAVRRRRHPPVQRAAVERREDRPAHPRGDAPPRRPRKGADPHRGQLVVGARARRRTLRLGDDRGGPGRAAAQRLPRRCCASAAARGSGRSTGTRGSRPTATRRTRSRGRACGASGRRADAPVDKPALAEFRRVALRVAGRG